MDVVIVPDAAAVAEHAAERIARVVGSRVHAVLGVATGSSPLGTYSALAERVCDGRLDLTGVGAFALDEYVGIDRAAASQLRLTEYYEHAQQHRSMVKLSA